MSFACPFTSMAIATYLNLFLFLFARTAFHIRASIFPLMLAPLSYFFFRTLIAYFSPLEDIKRISIGIAKINRKILIARCHLNERITFIGQYMRGVENSKKRNSAYILTLIGIKTKYKKEK